MILIKKKVIQINFSLYLSIFIFVKSILTLHLLYCGEARNEFVGPISASLCPGNPAFFEKRCSGGEPLAKLCPNLLDQDSNLRSSDSETSSVAREGGGSSPPIGLKSMQNTTFLVLLRPIFAPKMKKAPPQRDWRSEVVKDYL